MLSTARSLGTEQLMVGGMGDQHRQRLAGRRQGLLPQIGPGLHVAPMDPSASGRLEAIADRDLISPSIGSIRCAVDHPAGKRATRLGQETTSSAGNNSVRFQEHKKNKNDEE